MAPLVSRPTVLLIDDDPEVLDVLEECVGTIGYATVTAQTGATGLAAVGAAPPDVVLLDIAMPGTLGGVDTLRAIKRSWPDLPVIMVTANTDEALATATLREGVFDYVMKPVQITRLREVLAAATVLSGKEPPP
jgi:DNA-binding NtrC family response regulator